MQIGWLSFPHSIRPDLLMLYLLYILRLRHHKAFKASKAFNYRRALNHLLTHVILVRVACGSRITPAPYEKAQASEEICKRAAHPGSKLNQKKSVVLDVPVRVHACMYVCICAYVLEMNVRMWHVAPIYSVACLWIGPNEPLRLHVGKFTPSKANFSDSRSRPDSRT